MIDNLMINIATLYEFLDSTPILLDGEYNVLDVIEYIADHDGKIKIYGETWDFTKKENKND